MSLLRALLLLDVDGPLNPWNANPKTPPVGYTRHRTMPDAWIEQHPGKPRSYIKPLKVWLNPDHGPRLLALESRYELMWATTWGADANEWISPVLGLPQLPVLDLPQTNHQAPAGVFWKMPHIVDYAGGRPFAFLDDDLGPADQGYVDAHHPGRALLRRVDPRHGLVDDDFAALAAFTSPTRMPR